MNPSLKRKFQIAAGLGIFTMAIIVSYSSVTEVDTSKRDIYLLIDTSGSMTGESISHAKNAAIRFIDAFQLENSTDYRIGLISFESGVTVMSELTDDPRDLKEKVSKLQADGGTAMGEAIVTADNLFLDESRSDARKTILVLTDGVTTVGINPVEAAHGARNNDVVIFAVAYGSVANVYALSQISSMTGGKFYSALSGEDLVSTFGNIADAMVSPVAHYGSRTMILAAIPILLFIPVIERGMVTMVHKAEETFLDRKGTPRPTCKKCSTLNRTASKFCKKCGNPFVGGK